MVHEKQGQKVDDIFPLVDFPFPSGILDFKILASRVYNLQWEIT